MTNQHKLHNRTDMKDDASTPSAPARSAPDPDPPRGRVILAGGSGFLGRRLARALAERGDTPVILTRNPRPESPRPQAYWDGNTLGVWTGALDGAVAVVNLTGRNVNCRPSRAHREEILHSRVNSVRVLGQALGSLRRPPPVWVQASSLAIYGDAGSTVREEDGPVSSRWPSNVCTTWEAALAEAAPPEIRTVVLRIGFVLGREGGALPFLERLVRWGLGGSLGDGRQGISWLHAEDMIRLFLASIDDPRFRGVINATAPDPRENRDFMRALRRVLHRPWSPPAPSWAVHCGAWILGSDPVIALTGRHCRSRRLEELGFRFRFPVLEGALTNLYPDAPPRAVAAFNSADRS